MILAVSAAILSLWASAPAQAANKIKVVETQALDVPVAKVWAVVGDFTTLGWHPAVKATTAPNGNTKGSQRQVDLGGPVLVEQLVGRDEVRHRLTYKILDNGTNQKILPVSGYVSTIEVKAAGKGSIVVWQSSFHAAAGTEDAAAEKAIHGVYRGGLDNLPKALAQP